MAKKAQKGFDLFGCLALCAVVFWVSVFFVQYSVSTKIVGSIFTFLIVLGTGIAASFEEKRVKESAVAKTYSAIIDHNKTLLIRRRQLLLQDRYGVVDSKKWMKELKYFWEKVIIPNLNDGEIVALHEAWGDSFYKNLDDWLVALPATSSTDTPSFVGEDPVDYEHYCANLLNKIGWNARVTKGSNDQGADVVAQKNQIILVLQCKLYSKPVGNKAVQEAAAARAHEGANFAAVVTNNSFTRSAHSLSVSNDIALLNHYELADYAKSLT